MNRIEAQRNKELLYLDHKGQFDYQQLRLFQEWQLKTLRRPKYTRKELYLTH